MAREAVERASGGGRAGAAGALATAGGALLLLLALAAALVLTAETVARLGAGGSILDTDLLLPVTGYLGIGLAAASLLALPAALAAPFARRGEPPLRSHSALALVHGCLLAVAAWLAAMAVVLSSVNIEIGLQLGLRGLYSTFSDFTFLALPLAIVLGAALGGPRTPESAAAAAAPVVLVVISGVLASLSISGLLIGAALPLLAAALLLTMLYAAAPAFAVTPWLAGIGVALGMALLAATGLFTPTEAMALVALFGIPIALLVRALALRQPLAAMLRQAAMETVSVAAAMAAATAVGGAIGLAGIDRDLAEMALSPALIAASAALFAVACYLLTPVLALCVGLPFVLPPLTKAGFDPIFAGTVMALLGLAAAMARAGRDTPAGAGLPPAAAFIGAAVFAALGALIMFVPSIALAPVRAILP